MATGGRVVAEIRPCPAGATTLAFGGSDTQTYIAQMKTAIGYVLALLLSIWLVRVKIENRRLTEALDGLQCQVGAFYAFDIRFQGFAKHDPTRPLAMIIGSSQMRGPSPSHLSVVEEEGRLRLIGCSGGPVELTFGALIESEDGTRIEGFERVPFTITKDEETTVSVVFEPPKSEK